MSVIDIHLHYGPWYFPIHTPSIAEMRETLQRFGITRGIVSSSVALIYDFREGNRLLMEALAGHTDLLGYVTVNHNYVEESLQELETYLGEPNFVGVKMHPLCFRQPVDTPEGRRMVRAVAEHGVPLLVHTHTSSLESPWHVVPVAKENPSLPIIMAHMGGESWMEGIRVAQEVSNLYLEPCCSYPDADKLRLAVDAIGAERILFGSDYSLLDPAFTLGMVQSSGLTSTERDLVLEGNALRLFGRARDVWQRDNVRS